MKTYILIALTVVAFLTAAAFKSFLPSPTETVIKKANYQKQFSIRCSPLYIPAAGEDIPVLPGWGSYRWKITTSSDSALFYFNQGINMYYGFHIIEARASFDKATRFDPECAMAWYGKALAFGPNINDYEYQRPTEAYPSALKATALKNTCTPAEKALIDAMSVRYSDDTARDQTQLNILYKDEMSKVFQSFKTNENVSALYADALMLLHSWDLYNHDYTPKPWTPELVSVLKHTLRLNPKHPGANHLYIHAIEASAYPQDAMQSANFLAVAMPGVSHVTHMPSHIYIRSGNYVKGILVNDKAVTAYKNYLNLFPATEENVSLYELHNIHMKMNCAQMAGNFANARIAALELSDQIPSFYLQIPGPLGNYVQYLHQSPMFTLVRFGKWKEILERKVNDSLSFTAVLQHFSRGIAFSKTNNMEQAKIELSKMEAAMKDPALKVPLSPFNNAYDPSLVAHHILQGVIAQQQKDYNTAIIHFKKAVVTEDELIYNEPRDWLLPARQYLGNALIAARQYEEASNVFNKDLQINPENGWSLSGLRTCYLRSGKKSMIMAVNKRLSTAWKIKDMPIEAAVF